MALTDKTDDKAEKRFITSLYNASVKAAACIAFLFFAIDISIINEIRHDPSGAWSIILPIGFALLSAMNAASALKSFGKAMRAEIKKLVKSASE